MKTELGAKNFLYPLPTTIVGTIVDGKPSYITIAHVGIMDLMSISLGMNKAHHTNRGIRESGAFSVNIPSMDLMEVTDHVGLVSGKDEDKSDLFEVFYGKTGAPLIKECKVNMECELLKIVDVTNYDIFIGRIVNTFADDDCLIDGHVDLGKVDPMLFSMPDKGYWKLGARTGLAWSVGKGYVRNKGTR
jgi:flavin reductase (DIM6/NTAB) family NADH-FMN oxidoreductase RutF